MIPFRAAKSEKITDAEMRAVYERLKTPVKRGAVIKWESDYTDSPTVFRHGDLFYMYFIAISKNCAISGYETHLAVSRDLLSWEYLGPVFRRNELNRWDSKQCAGYAAFRDVYLDGSNELETVNGKYYLSYLAGNSDGYEPDPLFMGLAYTNDPTKADSFVRLASPILMPNDSDHRPLETKTLYKSCLFKDVLGASTYRYVNAYNAKAENGTERIFLAVSNDGERWERYGERHVLDMSRLDDKTIITGDPQILCIGDLYVAVFFHFAKGKGAYDTFAVSRDLVSWRIWEREPLVYPSEPFDNVHAHKPWIVCHGGVVHHFYCAVNDQNERFIALATSE